MANLLLRNANSSDLSEILILVKHLAKFEKAENEVTATIEIYQENFLRQFFCTIAELDGEIVGISLYYYGFSTWKGKMLYLDDLFVPEQYRGRGIGKALVHDLFKTANENNCQMVKWQVLDWNTEAIEFYKKIGMQIETEWYNCKKIL